VRDGFSLKDLLVAGVIEPAGGSISGPGRAIHVRRTCNSFRNCAYADNCHRRLQLL